MNLIERAKNMIITPKTEWLAVESENQDMKSIIMSYVLPFAVVSAICAFIGYAFIGGGFFNKSISAGLSRGILVFIATSLSMFISTFVIDMLAPSFDSEKNLNRSAQLVGFSITPSLIAGLFAIIPVLGGIAGLFGLYSIYLIYLGLGPMKKTPEDKKVIYLVVSFLIIAAIYLVLVFILGMILLPIFAVSNAAYSM